MSLSISEQQLKRDAFAIAQAAIRAADAGTAVARSVHLSHEVLSVGTASFALDHFTQVFSLAVGKAAVPMAASIEGILGPRLTAGLAVTKYDHAAVDLERTRVLQAGHPIPDGAGEEASGIVEQMMGDLTASDLLLVAVSGGASALLPAPVPGITLKEKQETTQLLLKAGATIAELNAVRKHLSTLKGGGLVARAYPATIVGLLLSDVVGDPLDVIGSGLTAPDPSCFADAIEVLERYDLRLRVPQGVQEHLRWGSEGRRPDTPKADSPFFGSVHNFVIGSNRLALDAGFLEAERLGYQTRILGSSVTGEARHVAGLQAAMLRDLRNNGSPIAAPACLLMGGETTVTVRGPGKGGRNQELALAAAFPLSSLPDVLLLSIGTDGTDGPTDAAGAFVTGTTLARAAHLGLNAQEHLAENNAYPFFDALGDLIRTGPTGTNVMDIQVLLAG